MKALKTIKTIRLSHVEDVYIDTDCEQGNVIKCEIFDGTIGELYKKEIKEIENVILAWEITKRSGLNKTHQTLIKNSVCYKEYKEEFNLLSACRLGLQGEKLKTENEFAFLKEFLC